MSTRFFERDLSFKKTGGDVPGDIFIKYSSENYSPDDMVNNGIILEYQNQNQPKYKACEKISFAWPLKLSLKCKKAVLKKMMPPRNRPLSQIAEEEGIVRPHCVIGVEKPDQKISWNLMVTQVLRDGMLGIKILHLVFAAPADMVFAAGLTADAGGKFQFPETDSIAGNSPGGEIPLEGFQNPV